MNVIDYFLWGVLVATCWMAMRKGITLYVPRCRPSVGSDTEFRHKLEQGMTFLSTAGSVSPFVGLTATILHIMDALRNMGQPGVAANAIAVPLAAALWSTLLGILIAVIAVVAWNFYSVKIEHLVESGNA